MNDFIKKHQTLLGAIAVISGICLVALFYYFAAHQENKINFENRTVAGMVADVQYLATEVRLGRHRARTENTIVKFADGTIKIFDHLNSDIVIGKVNEITYSYFPNYQKGLKEGSILKVVVK